MKKIKLLSMFMSVLMVFTTIIPATAQAQALHTKESINFSSDEIYIDDYLDQDDKNYLNKLVEVFDEFSLNSSGVLEIDKPLTEIQEKAGFTDLEMDRFNEIFIFSENNPNGSKTISKDTINNDNMMQPNVFVKNWRVHFTLTEVQDYFLAAAQIGPAAIIAALASLGTFLGGATGTAIGTIVGYIGGASFAYLVLRAVALKKGVYVGLEWDGPFPTYVDGTW